MRSNVTIHPIHGLSALARKDTLAKEVVRKTLRVSVLPTAKSRFSPEVNATLGIDPFDEVRSLRRKVEQRSAVYIHTFMDMTQGIVVFHVIKESKKSVHCKTSSILAVATMHKHHVRNAIQGIGYETKGLAPITPLFRCINCLI